MGEAAALGSAFLWALSNILMGSQSDRMPAIVISALRCVYAALFLSAVAVVLVLAGSVRYPSAVAALGLAGSGVLGLGVGDTLYIRGLGHIGVSRAFPVSMALYPLLTFVLAVAWLDEQVTPAVIAGTVLIIAGVLLVVSDRQAARRDEKTMPPGEAWLGVALVALASGLWAFASVWPRSAADGVQPVVAQAIRLPVAAIATAAVVRGVGHSLSPSGYGRRGAWALVATGVLGTGVGSMLFVIAVQDTGAAKTAVLSSTAPLFALPMAAALLSERITARVVVGTAVSIAGIWLVL